MACKLGGATCGTNGLRMGHCWDCVECESVLDDGTNMQDVVVAYTALQKLQWVLDKHPRARAGGV